MSGLCAICGSGRWCWIHDENRPGSEAEAVEQFLATADAQLMEDVENASPRCQPIGCDAGRHLPGCQFIEIDAGGGDTGER